jgi:UDP-N-acetylmuramyl pentapeptide phosphotransferase/UDP-N-acetylglucosamine-1-phosphate transferase
VQSRREPAARRRQESAKSDGGYRAPGSVGERPRAPWHPLPLDELLILIGLIAVAVGAARGESGKAVLFVGIGAVLIGTVDTTIREHLSGYRSHAGLLAAIPTALFHAAAAVGLYLLGAPSPSYVVIPLALDVPLFFVLLKLLRARFEDARRERVFAGARRR